jgi:uncharacterized RDD family membrane protein YckC
MAKQRFRDIKKGKIAQETQDYYYAPSRRKIKAFLTDAFMLLMPIMYIVFYLVMDGREGFAENKFYGWLYIVLPLVLVQTLFMYFKGQTPGYRNYGIKLIDNHSQERPSLMIILFRNLTAILSLLTLVGWMLMFFRKDSKNLHDLLSATSIVLVDAPKS